MATHSIESATIMTSFKRINLGCGYDIRDGYLNVDLNDFHGPDMVADISNLVGFPDGFYDEIVAQDVLEHMTRAVSKQAFKEWVRILSADGVLKVRIPSLLGLLSLLNEDGAWNADRHNHIVHLMFGTQAYNGDYHLAGFTPPILLEMASDAGVMISSVVLKDEWLYDIEFVKLREPTDEEFVQQLYFSICGRCGDPAGIEAHLNALKAGHSRASVRDVFLNSPEAKKIASSPSPEAVGSQEQSSSGSRATQVATPPQSSKFWQIGRRSR